MSASASPSCGPSASRPRRRSAMRGRGRSPAASDSSRMHSSSALNILSGQTLASAAAWVPAAVTGVRADQSKARLSSRAASAELALALHQRGRSARRRLRCSRRARAGISAGAAHRPMAPGACWQAPGRSARCSSDTFEPSADRGNLVFRADAELLGSGTGATASRGPCWNMPPDRRRRRRWFRERWHWRQGVGSPRIWGPG